MRPYIILSITIVFFLTSCSINSAERSAEVYDPDKMCLAKLTHTDDESYIISVKDYRYNEKAMPTSSIKTRYYSYAIERDKSV